MFELLLQMHKSAGSLDQAFEILRILGRGRLLQPNLLENIVRLIVTLLVPAAKKCAVIRMIGDGAAGRFWLRRLPALARIGKFSRLCS